MAVKQPGNDKNTVMEEALRKAGVSKENNVNQQNNQQQPTGQPNQPHQGGRGRRETLMSATMRSRSPIGRSGAGETVVAYNDAMKEILKANVQEGDDSHRLVLFDGSKNMTALSAIIVCKSEVLEGTTHVAFHTLLIEASGSRMANRTVNVSGHQVEIQTVAGDHYSGEMYRKVEEAVVASYGSGIVLHDTNATVVPSEMDPKDQSRLRNVLFNAVAACYNVLDIDLGAEAFSLVNVDTSAGTVLARLDFEPGQSETAAGLPIRTDVAVTLQAQSNNNQQNQYGQYGGQPEQVRDLARIEGYIDLVYDPNANQARVTPFGQPQQVTQLYFPRFVMTLADTCVDSISMEMILLGLSSATLLNQNANWVSAFLPRYTEGGKQVDLRDIGAVGYEANLTGAANPSEFVRIDTKTNFGPAQLQSLLSTVMHPALIYSMDIDEVSDLSWLHLTFIAAAAGAPEARQAILDAANTLTGNHFSKYFDPNAPIANDDVNRIHTGYYVDPTSGEKVDIRSIDYLAMLNLRGGNDLQSVVEFAETFDRTDMDLNYRLDRRLKLMRGIFQDALKIKGFARRITFNPDFINALSAGCHDAGLVIRPSNTFQEFGAGGHRGNPNIGNFALQNSQNQLFSYAQPSFGNNNANNYSVPMGRWGRG